MAMEPRSSVYEQPPLGLDLSIDGAQVCPVPIKIIAQAGAATVAAKAAPEMDLDDIFASDGKVDLRLLMIALWTSRKNEKYTNELCRRLSYINITTFTLDQVEFYLPQLAHMVIHLDTEMPMEGLEQFVLLLSQSSGHFALQLFWIIYAALDENRPKRNGNPRTFARCAQLLLSLEQCFVYGSPAAREASELLTRQSISREEMNQILNADRRFFAAQSSLENIEIGLTDKGTFEGWLYKKGGGTRKMGRRNWSLRWCRIERRILYVFSRPSDSNPRTAVPLDRADIRVRENPKHPFYFEIIHNYSETKVQLSAQSEEQMLAWVAHLQKTAAPPEPPAASSPSKTSPGKMLARMSFAMRSFILQSTSESMSTTAAGANSSYESESPVKTPRSISPLKTAQISAAEAISEQMNPPKQHVSSLDSVEGSESFVTSSSITDGMTDTHCLPLQSEQHRRYLFFCGMIYFVKAITDVSESLRRVEPAKRKALLKPRLKKLEIPMHAYIPLCKSTDPYCSVVSVFAEEGRVFNTNERAPCLIYFETEEDRNGNDVSKALFTELIGGSEDGDMDEDEVTATATVIEDELFRHELGDSEDRNVPTQNLSASGLSPFLKRLLASDERRQRLENIFGELSFTRAARLQQASRSSCGARWRLNGLISKSHDDLRQEVLVMQLISHFHHIFQLEGLPLRLRPYRILSTGSTTGLLELVQNSMSLDGIKKTPGFKNLRTHFERMYGDEENANNDTEQDQDVSLLRQAELNFIHSLAAYSIICYILSIKDRHNGNILLDVEGYIIHIDFGFFLGRAPGGSFSFETAPFKLTAEMVDVLGGRNSENFKYFSDLCVRGALAARKHAETIYALVEVMSFHSKLPCFVGNAATPLAGLRDRLFLNLAEEKVAPAILCMIERSYDHFGTTKYDQFQVYSNGIAK